MARLAVTIEDRLDERYGKAVEALRQEWAALMRCEVDSMRYEYADKLLDRANVLGIGCLDRP